MNTADTSLRGRQVEGQIASSSITASPRYQSPAGVQVIIEMKAYPMSPHKLARVGALPGLREWCIQQIGIEAGDFIVVDESASSTSHDSAQRPNAAPNPIDMAMRELARERGFDLDVLLGQASSFFQAARPTPRHQPLAIEELQLLIEDDEHDAAGRLS